MQLGYVEGVARALLRLPKRAPTILPWAMRVPHLTAPHTDQRSWPKVRSQGAFRGRHAGTQCCTRESDPSQDALFVSVLYVITTFSSSSVRVRLFSLLCCGRWNKCQHKLRELAAIRGPADHRSGERESCVWSLSSRADAHRDKVLSSLRYSPRAHRQTAGVTVGYRNPRRRLQDHTHLDLPHDRFGVYLTNAVHRARPVLLVHRSCLLRDAL
ncbi:hypothetical protein BJY52DRAFT_1271319 [Lactarius psammicola]|nr:hypothetical protein BJY52DRAFT_1271319 [Lactarius psammicola]